MNQFFPFEEFPHLAVAVSGGPDSLALCFLLQEWVLHHKGRLTALTFDHRLRPNSAEEAQQVHQWLTAQGISHQILTWSTFRPTTDIQNKARLARYQALEEWCKDHHVMHLFLGHHQEDQEETIFQRLLHGSGPIGLQGIQACTFRPFGRLLRPLLSFTKQELVDYLTLLKHPFCSDPSNFNTHFERVKIRSLLPTIHNLTSTPFPFSQVALKCKSFVHLAEEQMIQFCLHSLSFHPLGFVTLKKDAFLSLPLSLQFLILSKLLQAIGGGLYPFSSKTLTSVIDKILRQKNTTLGGCFIIQKAQAIWITREERAVPSFTLINKSALHWDNRFLFDFPEKFIGKAIIPGAKVPRSFFSCLPFSSLPRYVLKTLPFLQYSDDSILSFFPSLPQVKVRPYLHHRLAPSPFPASPESQEG